MAVPRDLVDAVGGAGAYRGDPYEHTFTFQTLDDEGNAVPWDLSDGTFQAQWRPAPLSPDSDAVVFDIDDSRADEGIVVISLTGEQTRSIRRHRGFYDLQHTYTVDGSVHTLVGGQFQTTGDVTRVFESEDIT